MRTSQLPVWYDPICITTSLVYACISLLLLDETSDSLWCIVVASGVISMLFRIFRSVTRYKRGCSLERGFLCNNTGAFLFCADLLLAILSIVMLCKKVNPIFSLPLIGILTCSWSLHHQNKNIHSCMVHTSAHIMTCAVLFTGLQKVRNIYER